MMYPTLHFPSPFLQFRKALHHNSCSCLFVYPQTLISICDELPNNEGVLLIISPHFSALFRPFFRLPPLLFFFLLFTFCSCSVLLHFLRCSFCSRNVSIALLRVSSMATACRRKTRFRLYNSDRFCESKTKSSFRKRCTSSLSYTLCYE